MFVQAARNRQNYMHISPKLYAVYSVIILYIRYLSSLNVQELLKRQENKIVIYYIERVYLKTYTIRITHIGYISDSVPLGQLSYDDYKHLGIIYQLSIFKTLFARPLRFVFFNKNNFTFINYQQSLTYIIQFINFIYLNTNVKLYIYNIIRYCYTITRFLVLHNVACA